MYIKNIYNQEIDDQIMTPNIMSEGMADHFTKTTKHKSYTMKHQPHK